MAYFPAEDALFLPMVTNNAIAAARRLIEDIEAANEARAAGGHDPVRFGVGLHIGPVTFGNIGTEDRLDFTVIGPAVNRAARLEGLTKVLGVPVLASAEFNAASTIPMKSLGKHTLRGVPEPVEVFTPAMKAVIALVCALLALASAARAEGADYAAPGSFAVQTIDEDLDRHRAPPAISRCACACRKRWSPCRPSCFSHGLGGSRSGGATWGEHWASHGFAVIHVQHPGSDEALWRDKPVGERLAGLKSGATLQQFVARIGDVKFVLDELTRRHRRTARSRPPRHERSFVRRRHDALYSAASSPATSRTSASRRSSPSARRPRPVRTPPTQFASFTRPALLVTGTLDGQPFPGLGATAAQRLMPFKAMPATGNKFLLVLNDADHMYFNGTPGLREHWHHRPWRHRFRRRRGAGVCAGEGGLDRLLAGLPARRPGGRRLVEARRRRPGRTRWLPRCQIAQTSVFQPSIQPSASSSGSRLGGGVDLEPGTELLRAAQLEHPVDLLAAAAVGVLVGHVAERDHAVAMARQVGAARAPRSRPAAGCWSGCRPIRGWRRPPAERRAPRGRALRAALSVTSTAWPADASTGFSASATIWALPDSVPTRIRIVAIAPEITGARSALRRDKSALARTSWRGLGPHASLPAMDETPVLSALDGGVLSLTLNRPAAAERHEQRPDRGDEPRAGAGQGTTRLYGRCC